MATVLMFKTGSQYRIDPEAVERMAREYNVTSRRTNGAQTQFNFNDAEYPFSIVANNESEAYESLEYAYKEARKRNQ